MSNVVRSGISSEIYNEFNVLLLLFVTVIVYIIVSPSLTELYPVEVVAFFVTTILFSFTLTSGVDTFNICGLQLTLWDSHGSSTIIFSVVVVASPSLSPACTPAFPAPAPAPLSPVAPPFSVSPAAPFSPFPALPTSPLAFAPLFAFSSFLALSPVPSVGVFVPPFSLPLLSFEAGFPWLFSPDGATSVAVWLESEVFVVALASLFPFA